MQPYQALDERIRGEIPELDRAVQRSLWAWSQRQDSPVSHEVYLDSVALNLHGFYSGLERLFELIARHIDQRVPEGRVWHRDLLRQMTREIVNVRPAVISQESAEGLDAFRRFRHLVRNVYTFDLLPEKMESLLQRLPDVWKRVRLEVLAFADYLDALSQAGRS